MKLKRLFALAGVVALIGVLWASPAAADGHLPSITLDPAAVPAEEGAVTVTVSGANWTEPSPFFIVACPGAAGDPTAPLALSSAPEAIAMCPDLMASAVAVEWDDGGFATEWTTTITGADIDNGALVILAGWLSVDTLSDPEEYATVGVLAIGAEEPMEEPPAEEPMDEPAEEPMDDPVDEPAEEPMDDPGSEELPATGHESGLLVVVGASILAAGLLVIGAGRRVRTATR
ncbi:MAG: LPXTG cell wall anchor domain-containing protein [bacterium]|nr:LPXTG cell wall anchor domain-containing protein [bacterium]MCY3926158.1 LPXTG cell wall anchor domain-containing protein [bacterium]